MDYVDQGQGQIAWLNRGVINTKNAEQNGWSGSNSGQPAAPHKLGKLRTGDPQLCIQ